MATDQRARCDGRERRGYPTWTTSRRAIQSRQHAMDGDRYHTVRVGEELVIDADMARPVA